MKRALIAVVASVAMMAGCAKVPDESLWIISQPGTTYVRTAKGRPVVTGNTCTYIDASTGAEITINGRFEIQPYR